MSGRATRFRVLHVASFSGNIGDNISHLGLRNILNSSLGLEYSEVELEIRRTYLNYSLPDKLRLDVSFSELCNSFDLVVFGGGNLLEPFQGSSSGTRLSFEKDAIGKISVPMIFASVGMIPREPLEDDLPTARRHRGTLELLANKSNIAVIVRNDGTPEWLTQNYPSLSGAFRSGLDAGFFASFPGRDGDASHESDSGSVVLNLSLDQMESAVAAKRPYSAMLEIVGTKIIARLGESQDNFVFIPHVHHDLRVFTDLMNVIPDYFARSRFSVASLSPGPDGAVSALQAYSSAKEAWSMRFHSAVSAIVGETPLVPFVPSNRMESLLDSVGFAGERVRIYSSEQLTGPSNPSPQMVDFEHLRMCKDETVTSFRESLDTVLN